MWDVIFIIPVGVDFPLVLNIFLIFTEWLGCGNWSDTYWVESNFLLSSHHMGITILTPIFTPSCLNNPIFSINIFVPSNNFNYVLPIEFECSLTRVVNSVFIRKKICVTTHRGNDWTFLNDLSFNCFWTLNSTVSSNDSLLSIYSFLVFLFRTSCVLPSPGEWFLMKESIGNTIVEGKCHIATITVVVLIVTWNCILSR
jgi:hypothetical protein